jgi:glycosyltransferase involved in cell wall biosynthesis
MPTVPPLRVLWAIKGLGPGGAERLLVNQAATRAPDVEYEAVYLVAAKDQLVPELEALGVEVRGEDVRRDLDLRWAWRLHRRLARGGVDVVHVHSPFVAAWVRLAVRLLFWRRPALVYTEHNRWTQYSTATRLLNASTYLLDDWQIAVSDGVRSSVPPRLRRRLETVVHGIDREAVAAQASARDDVRRELGVGPDTVVVGIVANFRAEKAYADLVRAVELLPADLPVLVIAVGQGPVEDEIRALVAAKGLGDRMRLLGYRPDATRLMSGFDVFVLSSHHEGLPVAAMEAQTLGLPIVATAVGGMPEVVTEGVDGRLVPPARPDLLAAALADVVADAEHRAAMGAAARRAGERFDGRAATARIEAGYRRVAAKRGR